MLPAFEKLSENQSDRILNAAAKIFAENGYHAASIAKLCKEMEISNGALYTYFKNKEDLFFEVLDRGLDLMVQELFVKYTVSPTSIYDSVYQFLNGIVYLSNYYKDYLTIYADLGSCSVKHFAIKSSEKFELEASKYLIQMTRDGKRLNDIDDRFSDGAFAFLIDNYFMLFIYSLVSDYHHRRFESFFCPNEGPLNTEDKIDLIMQSIRIIID